MKNSLKKIIIISLLCLFSTLLFSQEYEVTTITINNARQTNYKKSEESGNDSILLEGDVELVVKKGSVSSSIKADKITYDRKTEMLYAEGNVEISTSSSTGEDSTSASSLLLNTSTLEGVFDGGRVVQTQSDSLNLPSGSTLIVFSELFGKGSSNTIAFKNSSLTFCDDESPHWKINASRTWLLPGGEFAFFNALLYVGSIPVLYLPAFYYPKDELVFNPVFNYRKREGYSIQTTTYIWGRKPLDTSSSSSSDSSSSSTSSSAEALTGLYNFVKPSTLKEQKLEGLILHNLDEDYKGDTNQYAKILADWYSNLGYMIGFDASLKPDAKYLTNLSLSADIGISNTIFQRGNKYYPFSTMGNTYKDEATFLGFTTPFRYSADLELTLSNPFKLTLSLPVYSDPYYEYDFKTYRQESMDWISYLLENAAANSSNETISISEVTSYAWKLTASVSPTLPDFIKPYISSLSLNWNSNINISSVSARSDQMTYKGSSSYESEWKSYSPTRKFYYPSLVTPVSSSLSVSGNIFSWPLKTKSANKENVNYAVTLNKPDELKSEKELEKEKFEEEKSGESENKSQVTENQKNDEEEPFEYYLPDLAFKPSVKSLSQALTYSLDYNLSANLVMQSAYSSANLYKSEDFDWQTIRSSMYTLKTPLSLTSKCNYGGDFLSVSNAISYSPVYQKHTYISSDTTNYNGATIGYTKTASDNLILADYKAESQDISNNNTITFKPFINSKIFKDTSLSWNSTIKVYRREFIGDVENPQWENYGPDWSDEDSVTVNSLTGLFSAKEFNDKVVQSLSLSAIMPPLLRQYTATFSFYVPYLKGSISTGIQENSTSSDSSSSSSTTTSSSSDSQWTKKPLQQSLSLSFPLFNKSLSFTESFNYNLQDNNPESLKLSTSWNGLSFSYIMSYAYGYTFDSGWIAESEKKFHPYSLSFSYAPTTKTYYSWFNRIAVAPGLSTSVVADLLRPTNSYFLFSPSISFKLQDFLTLTFSSTSRNSVLYWYFHNEEGDLYSDWGGFPGNVFKDLIDSFRFDNQSLREGSGFKLKSLNMTLAHNLHDWTFNMTVKVEPRVVTENGTRIYDFNPYITIGVMWNPMQSIKTSIVDEYGEWYLE